MPAVVITAHKLPRIPFILFIAGLGILYIANAHYSEKNVRELNQIEKELVGL